MLQTYATYFYANKQNIYAVINKKIITAFACLNEQTGIA